MIKTGIRKILKKLRKSRSDAIFYQNKDIELSLQQNAVEETSRYILENDLLRVRTFNSALDLIEFSIENIKISNGIILEFWVFKGATVNFISSKLAKSQVYWFDSFEWLPEDWRSNFLSGHFKLEMLPKVNSNVTLVKGWFNEVLPGFVLSNKAPVAFLHVDCDLYSSTKAIFENLGDSIISWTVIVFDEYWNYAGWKQWEFKAFNEFLDISNKKFEYLWYNQKHEQVAIRIL